MVASNWFPLHVQYQDENGEWIRWLDAEHPTPGATPATPECKHWGHHKGEWKYSCCACSGAPGGCSACQLSWD